MELREGGKKYVCICGNVEYIWSNIKDDKPECHNCNRNLKCAKEL